MNNHSNKETFQGSSGEECRFFLRTPDGRLLSASQNITFSKAPRADALSVFAPDFFLNEPAPWLNFSEWCEGEAPRWGRGVASGHRQPLSIWNSPSRAQFEQQFLEIQQAIAGGSISKAVPVVFASASFCCDTWKEWTLSALSRLIDVAQAHTPYGLWTPRGGVLGATPEILFEYDGKRHVRTMAIAGTAVGPAAAEALFGDAKERHEHQLVVDDIVESLGALGDVRQGATDVLSLGMLSHLHTPIEATLHAPARCEDLVRCLHPTPALGVAPRRAGLQILSRQDGESPQRRGRFGAPLAVVWPDNRCLCLVAIRNVQWDFMEYKEGSRPCAHVTMGSGCGVVSASQLPKEWEELAAKRRAVQRLLGLNSIVQEEDLG